MSVLIVYCCCYYDMQARMLVESGLVLALNLKDVKAGGGVWTPAACQVHSLTMS